MAPRMAKCGHIFCLQCLIRYMHSSDDTNHYPEKKARWKKCPICWDAIYVSEVRPVRWYQGQEQDAPKEGGDIVLRLVVRSAGSTLALPKEASSSSLAGDEDIPWHFAADVMDFSRVMKGTAGYMVVQHDEEIEKLEELARHDELMFDEDAEWTTKAIRSIQEAKERLKEILASLSIASSEGPSKVRPSPEPSTPSSKPADATASALSTSLSAFRAQQSHQPPAPGPSDYYFYQALLHYYLSPLDIRILKSGFGDFSSFPSTILPRVERVSTGHVVDDELRRRAKYLAHLPHGCEVAFLECDWTDTVPAAVLEQFKADIDKRRKRNTDKDAREERERIRAEKDEDDKRWAAARRRRPTSINYERDAVAPQDFLPLNGAGYPASDSIGLESTSPMWASHSRGGNGSSFATLASPSTSPSESRTVWGTAAIAPMSPPSVPLEMQEPQPGTDDGWLQGWEKDLLDEDDVIAQVQALSFGGSADAGSGPDAGEGSSRSPMAATGGGGNAPSSSAKKKKGKKITLMSTNARRGA